MPTPKPPTFSREALRRIDETALKKYCLPGIVLMENAAIALAGHVLATCGRSRPARVLLFCGKGNNGGDGLAAARHLHNAGARVAAISMTGPYSIDAGVNLGAVMQMPVLSKLVREPAEVERAVNSAIVWLIGREHPCRRLAVVDALLGTGLSRPVKRGTVLAALIAAINDLRATDKRVQVVAADIPSGLDADTGEPMVQGESGPTAVRADLTVSFVGRKRGFAWRAARPFIGKVKIGDIGAPIELVRGLADY